MEVLPQAEYDDEHLPGAVSIPLKELDGSSTGSLDLEAPVRGAGDAGYWAVLTDGPGASSGR